MPHISVHLKHRSNLFESRTPDPFEDENLYPSGIEQIHKELTDSDLRTPPRITITLPSAEIAEDTVDQIQYALERTCRHEEDQLKKEMRSARWEGIKALQTGVVFLLICMLGAFFIQKAEPFGEFLNFILEEGLFIIGWVSMWRSVDLLLFGWWPLHREGRIYRAIRSAKVEVEAAEGRWARNIPAV